MNIPFPCSKSLSEMRSESGGFFCSDCKIHLIDTRNPDSPPAKSGDCVITVEPQEKYEMVNLRNRFLLAMVIVIGSSLFLNHNAKADSMIQKLESIKNFMLGDSTMYLGGSVTDSKGKPVRPFKVTVLIDGKDSITQINYHYEYYGSSYYFDLKKSDWDKKLTVIVQYYDQVKTVEYRISREEDEFIPVMVFQRDKKDKHNKKRFPKVKHFIGTKF